MKVIDSKIPNTIRLPLSARADIPTKESANTNRATITHDFGTEPDTETATGPDSEAKFENTTKGAKEPAGRSTEPHVTTQVATEDKTKVASENRTPAAMLANDYGSSMYPPSPQSPKNAANLQSATPQAKKLNTRKTGTLAAEPTMMTRKRANEQTEWRLYLMERDDIKRRYAPA